MAARRRRGICSRRICHRRPSLHVRISRRRPTCRRRPASMQRPPPRWSRRPRNPTSDPDAPRRLPPPPPPRARASSLASVTVRGMARCAAVCCLCRRPSSHQSLTCSLPARSRAARSCCRCACAARCSPLLWGRWAGTPSSGIPGRRAVCAPPIHSLRCSTIRQQTEAEVARAGRAVATPTLRGGCCAYQAAVGRTHASALARRCPTPGLTRRAGASLSARPILQPSPQRWRAMRRRRRRTRRRALAAGRLAAGHARLME